MTVVAFKDRCVLPALLRSPAFPVDVAGLTLWALHLADFLFAAASKPRKANAGNQLNNVPQWIAPGHILSQVWARSEPDRPWRRVTAPVLQASCQLCFGCGQLFQYGCTACSRLTTLAMATTAQTMNAALETQRSMDPLAPPMTSTNSAMPRIPPREKSILLFLPLMT